MNSVTAACVRLALALTDTVTIGVVGRILRMAGKPVVLPDMFSGEGNWEDWFDHFNNVAAVNKWTDEQKLLWVKVRLTTPSSYSTGRPKQPPSQKRQSQSGSQHPPKTPTSTIVCHKCGVEGHYARGCASKRNRSSGNERPSA